MRVAVLGHRGMLGRVVARRFRELGATVVTSDLIFPHESLVEWAEEADAVVNCIGRKDGSLREMVYANEVLPAELALIDRPVIHASTDAIGETTYYARTKRHGEVEGNINIRCAIIGLGAGILGKLEANQGKTLTGYTDWLWSGVTTLEWADVAWEALNDPTPRLIVPGSPPVSRYALMLKAAHVFGWDVRVRPATGPYPIDRVQTPTVHCAGISFQLRRLAKWSR